MQSRGHRLRDVLSTREANEIADTPQGVSVPSPQATETEEKQAAVNAVPELARSVKDLTNETKGTSQRVAKIRKDGKVEFEEVGRTK